VPSRWGGEPPPVPVGPMPGRQLWLAGKALDELPGEWTYNVWVLRAQRFHFQVLPIYYEPFYSSDLLPHGLAFAAVINHAFDAPRCIVNVAFEAHESIFDAPDGRIELPEEDERFVGSHSVHMTGWNSEDSTFSFQNSWGPEWGKAGRGQVSSAYLERYGWDAWLSWNGKFHPAWSSIEWILGELSQRDRKVDTDSIKRAWITKGPVGTERISRHGSELVMRWRLQGSLTARTDTSVVEAWVDNRLVGWCMAAQGTNGDDGKRVLFVFEFFVWPTYRRNGVAHQLMRSLLGFSKDWKPEALEILIHASDWPNLLVDKIDRMSGCTWSEGKTWWPPGMGTMKIVLP
jgi:GNAT superfamily N-acetyltransferase